MVRFCSDSGILRFSLSGDSPALGFGRFPRTRRRAPAPRAARAHPAEQAHRRDVVAVERPLRVDARRADRARRRVARDDLAMYLRKHVSWLRDVIANGREEDRDDERRWLSLLEAELDFDAATASPLPVDSPAGAIARPTAP